MKTKAFCILGVCGLIVSSIAFANSAMMTPLTPSEKKDVAQEYQDGGKHVENADDVYNHLDDTKQDALKQDEVQHRENIYDERGHNARENGR